MNRIRRMAWIAGSGLAALLLAATAPLRPGAPVAQAQQAAPGPAAQSETRAVVGAESGSAAGSTAGSASGAAAGSMSAAAAPAGAASGAAPAEASAPAEVPELEGLYDIEELRRLVELARESGFSEEQVRQITVEDVNGRVVNAWAFLQAYDRRQRREAARLAADEGKVYLSPKDIIRELDQKQAQDLNHLRDKLLFVE